MIPIDQITQKLREIEEWIIKNNPHLHIVRDEIPKRIKQLEIEGRKWFVKDVETQYMQKEQPLQAELAIVQSQ